MRWYKLAEQTWTVRCPRCNAKWQIDQSIPGWIGAREKQLQGREAMVTCDECLRKKREEKA